MNIPVECASRPADQVRAGGQYEDRESSGSHPPGPDPRARRRGHRMMGGWPPNGISVPEWWLIKRTICHRAAPPTAEPGRCRGLGQQDRAYRLGGDVPPAELPASVRGGINRRQTRACERARKRDGTVGRSDAIESSLALHRDSDPVRMMRPRCAEPIRTSSPPGLHQQMP